MGKTLRQKNRIFDLVGLGDIVSKKFLSKSLRKNQNLQLLKAKLIHLTILIKEISIMLGELGAEFRFLRVLLNTIFPTCHHKYLFAKIMFHKLDFYNYM